MGWEFNVGFLRYGAGWRKHRKAMHQALNPQAMMGYRPIQLARVRQFAHNVLVTPEEMEAHIRT